jgi:hypothetical protein
MTTLDWIKNDHGDGEYVKTEDGYLAGWRKMEDVRLDGYLGQVDAPNWTYTGRFATSASAKSWANHIVARDRRFPMSNQPARAALNDVPQ